jgi:hypothetical protein
MTSSKTPYKYFPKSDLKISKNLPENQTKKKDR